MACWPCGVQQPLGHSRCAIFLDAYTPLLILGRHHRIQGRALLTPDNPRHWRAHRTKLGQRRNSNVCCSQPSDCNTLSPPHSVVIHSGEKEVTLECGEIGRQANGAVMCRSGNTIVYATACCTSEAGGDGSFMPLTVHYTERFSAAGRTAGGWLKREGRPKDAEVLTSRLIDRPLRPMFAPGWSNDTQVLVWVMSYDGIHPPEPLAITAAAAALSLSDIPLSKAVAGVRVGRIEGRGFVVAPTEQEMEQSSLDLMLAGTADAVLMIEGYCDFLSEEQMLEAVTLGQRAVAEQCRAIDEWAKKVGKQKLQPTPPSTKALEARIEGICREDLEAAYRNIEGKHERSSASKAIQEGVMQQLGASQSAQGAEVQDGSAGTDEAVVDEEVMVPVDDVEPPTKPEFARAFKKVESRLMRELAMDENVRADGRACDEVRPIACRAGLLPCTHGSALFTRGQTQTIAVTTLGSEVDAQQRDEMSDASTDRFFLQYYFPPSSVGETGRVGAPGRREIGHGQLAQRALSPIIPQEEDFPYTIRVESTVTESNGSSSMATVCGGYLALRDAGVPVKRPVAGVAMGLMLEENGRFQILTDILGSEDAMGDMDFKVAGDADAITAFQMDIKVEGITVEILGEALRQARSARAHILAEMERCSPAPRGALADNAPRIRIVTVDPERIGVLIGPGGRTIRALEAESGAEQIQVVDGFTGRIEVRAPTDDSLAKALELVIAAVATPEVGKIYRNCKVDSVEKFGLLVEILPGKTGLVHTSELDVDRTVSPESFNAGDRLDVKCLEVLDGGKLKLSRKAVQVTTGKKEEEIEMPEEGKIYRDCPIVGTATFGVFVEVVPGMTGLVHVTEMSASRVDLADYPEGMTIDVKVLEIQKTGRIRLSRKEALRDDQARGKVTSSSSATGLSAGHPPDPSAAPASGPTLSPAASRAESNGSSATALEGQPAVGHTFRDAKVIEVGSEGVHVELEPGMEGFVPAAELDVTSYPGLRTFRPGETINVKLLEVQEDGSLVLSRRAAFMEQLGLVQADQKERQPQAGLPQEGDILRGVEVKSMSSFGLFVQIAPEVLGLIHVTELEPHKYGSVSDYQVGDKVDVKVLEAGGDGKYRLSRKQAILDDLNGEPYQPPHCRPGYIARNRRVTNITDFGIFVRVAPGATGLVHRSQLGIEDEDVEDYFEVGERVDVVVLDYSPAGKLHLALIEDEEDDESAISEQALQASSEQLLPGRLRS